MSRIEKVSRESLPELEPMFQQLEQGFGFLPNDYLAMAHKPNLLQSVVEWTSAIMFGEGKIEMPLRILITYVVSKTYGCMYCTSHCISLGTNNGIPMEKIEGIEDFETSDHFSPRERAALNLAKKSNQQPNAVTDADFKLLNEHFDKSSVVEIMGLIAMMSFYNKWNETVNTAVEAASAEKSSKVSWWSAGKHSIDKAQ